MNRLGAVAAASLGALLIAGCGAGEPAPAASPTRAGFGLDQEARSDIDALAASDDCAQLLAQARFYMAAEVAALTAGGDDWGSGSDNYLAELGYIDDAMHRSGCY